MVNTSGSHPFPSTKNIEPTGQLPSPKKRIKGQMQKVSKKYACKETEPTLPDGEIELQSVTEGIKKQ